MREVKAKKHCLTFSAASSLLAKTRFSRLSRWLMRHPSSPSLPLDSGDSSEDSLLLGFFLTRTHCRFARLRDQSAQ
jgi:hypothetical protein